MGYRIFAHAVQLLLGHLGDALRISGLLYLMSSGLSFVLLQPLRAQLQPGAQPSVGVSLLILAIYLLSIFVGIWIAVAWHRYVLVDEYPFAILPRFDGNRVLAYFGYTIIIALISVGVLVPFALVGGFFVAATGWMAMLFFVGVPAMLLLIVVLYRVSLVLPAASLGKAHFGVGDAWRATHGTSGTMLAISLLTALAIILLSLPIYILAGLHLTVLAEIWSVIVNWFILMVSVGIASTLYGHYVEGRPVT